MSSRLLGGTVRNFDGDAEGFRAARYGLQGALVAVAAAGVGVSLFGFPQSKTIDLVAAIIGLFAVLAVRHLFHHHQIDR